MTRFTLAGDRHHEYSWTKGRLPDGSGLLLDLGCGPKANMSRYAVSRGWHVIGIDLLPVGYTHPHFSSLVKDFLKYDFEDTMFDWILNISSIEHFGVKGRYGVNRRSATADLRAMKKLHSLMKPEATMSLTIPVGIDTLAEPHHRVYGKERLPKLLNGFKVIDQQYWAKFDGVNEFRGTGQSMALNTVPIVGPPNYYAIGAFLLKRGDA